MPEREAAGGRRDEPGAEEIHAMTLADLPGDFARVVRNGVVEAALG